MTTFRGDIEMTSSRKDGNCSRCTIDRLQRGVKPFKAKFLIGGNAVGKGQVALDGSPVEPLTMEQYSVLVTACGMDMTKMWKVLNRKESEGHEVCGYCKNSLRQRDWMLGYEREALAAWHKEL